MNAINVDIVRSLFMPLFLGGTLAAAALAVMAILRWGEPGAMVMFAGGELYVDPGEICMLGTKIELLRTLAAAANVKLAAVGVRNLIPKATQRPSDMSPSTHRNYTPSRKARRWRRAGSGPATPSFRCPLMAPPTTVRDKLKEIGLDSAAAVTLAMARDRAREVLDLIYRGFDPVELRREARAKQVMTFDRALDLYIAAKKEAALINSAPGGSGEPARHLRHSGHGPGTCRGHHCG